MPDDLQGVVKVRTPQEAKDREAPDPRNTRKTFMTDPNVGVTAPERLPDDFNIRPIFPSLRPVYSRDLLSLTKEYYLFHHGLWLTWGCLPVDPLVEFYVRDGERNKCVWFVPLKDQILHGVARNDSETPSQLGVFAIPRDRMRDVLFWLDGVVMAQGGVFCWSAIRQHLPLDRTASSPVGRDDPACLALYGLRGRDRMLIWAMRPDGYYVVERQLPSREPEEPEKKIIVP